MYIGLYVRYPLFLSDFKRILNFLDRFSKNTTISHFMKILLVGAELFRANRETLRHDEADSFCYHAPKLNLNYRYYFDQFRCWKKLAPGTAGSRPRDLSAWRNTVWTLLFQGFTPAFAGRDWRKSRTRSVKTAAFRLAIWSVNLRIVSRIAAICRAAFICYFVEWRRKISVIEVLKCDLNLCLSSYSYMLVPLPFAAFEGK